jgi:hypothetical protein
VDPVPRDLVVRLNIPVTEGIHSPGDSIVFTHWLPLSVEESLFVEREDIELRLWFDIECTLYGDSISVADVPRHVQLPVSTVRVDVTIRNVPDPLTEFIYAERDRFDYAHLPTDVG